MKLYFYISKSRGNTTVINRDFLAGDSDKIPLTEQEYDKIALKKRLYTGEEIRQAIREYRNKRAEGYIDENGRRIKG